MKLLYQVEYIIAAPECHGKRCDGWILIHGMDQRQFENKEDDVELGRKLKGIFHIHETTGKKLSWRNWIFDTPRRHYATSFENAQRALNSYIRSYA